MPQIYEVQMRFSDLDAMGHVNHVRFLTYLEDARASLLKQLAEATEGSLPGVILAHIDCDYLLPLSLSQEPVIVETWLSRLGTKSFTLEHAIRHAGQQAATAKTVMVAFDYQTQATREFTAAEREILARLESTSTMSAN